MYVIKGSIAGVDTIVPADRCEWSEATGASGTGYMIDNVKYRVAADTTDVDDALLGYVSKTGRFVAITKLS